MLPPSNSDRGQGSPERRPPGRRSLGPLDAIGRALRPVVSRMPRSRKRLLLLAGDSALVPVSLFLAAYLEGYAIRPGEMPAYLLVPFIAVILLGPAVFQALGLPGVKLITYEARAILKTGLAAMLLVLAGLSIQLALRLSGTSVRDAGAAGGSPADVMLVFGVIFFTASVTGRLLGLRLLEWIYDQGGARTRVLIYGAGGTGTQLTAALARSDDIEPVAFVDDNPSLQGLMIAGRKVYPPAAIPRLVEQLGIHRVVLAIPSASRVRQQQIAQRLEKLGCQVQRLPSFAELIGSRNIDRRLEPVRPAEFLGRERFAADQDDLVDSYRGKVVLVTGAGGSIGSELCRQVLPGGPAALLLLDHSEAALYSIEKELRTLIDDSDDPVLNAVEMRAVLGSVCDRSLVARVLRDNSVDVVLHAAAYKHVPLVEENPIEGLRNNVLGTHVTATAATEAGVERFILVSSDKAVRPTNVMGASKRMAELVVQDLARRNRKTLFAIVRFGNVLGSSGSVLPLFQEQIARGGPVTLTDPDVTRYFMTVTEAAQLVLIAGCYTTGGDLFVLDMGKPIPIRKLARQMIERAGFTVRDQDNPDGDIRIVITGLRPGEKLHEELLMTADVEPTGHRKILRAHEPGLSELETAAMLRDLRRVIADRDVESVEALVEKWVEGYHAPSVRANGRPAAARKRTGGNPPTAVTGDTRPGASEKQPVL